MVIDTEDRGKLMIEGVISLTRGPVGSAMVTTALSLGRLE
jgi:hypothetical protein